jgi:hypothetical protein
LGEERERRKEEEEEGGERNYTPRVIPVTWTFYLYFSPHFFSFFFLPSFVGRHREEEEEMEESSSYPLTTLT